MASSTVSAKTETQSSVRQAGTTPAVETRPRLGFSPTMLLNSGRHAARARGVGAERQRRNAGADRQRRAGARSAGDELGVEQIAADAVRRAHADEAGGELIEIGLAENERAGLRAAARPRSRPCSAIEISRDRRRWSADP